MSFVVEVGAIKQTSLLAFGVPRLGIPTESTPLISAEPKGHMKVMLEVTKEEENFQF